MRSLSLLSYLPNEFVMFHLAPCKWLSKQFVSRRRFTIYCRQIEALTPPPLAASGPSGLSPEINSRKGSIVIQQLNCTSAESGMALPAIPCFDISFKVREMAEKHATSE